MITEAQRPASYVGKQVQRYRIFGEIAAGGMATVHLARLTGPAGFSRIVAVKHLHPHFSTDPEFRAMLIDEAWLAARIRHPNVVPTLDVLVEDGEIFLVMEYVHGEPLNVLRRATEKLGLTPAVPICSAIMVGALHGLHAAHDARSETGQMLHIVHRDVSPQNIIVSADGVSMVLDFGVAKAMQAHEETKPGVIKGKSGYMAPEQIRGEEVTRAADIFAASVVLWELLTSRRLFGGGSEMQRMNRVLRGTGVVPPSQIVSNIPAEIDAIVMKGLCPDPKQRYGTALEMADALEKAIAPASQRTLAAWVRFISAESLGRRAELMNEIDRSAVTMRATAEIEAPTIVSVAQAPEPSRFRAPAVWRERRVFIGVGVAAGAALSALLLLMMLASGASRRRHAAAVPGSAARVVSRAAPPGWEASPPSPRPAVERPASAQDSPEARAASSAAPSNDREPERPRRWAIAIPRKNARERSGIRQSAWSMSVARAPGARGAPSLEEPTTTSPDRETAEPSPSVAPSDERGGPPPGGAEAKGRAPLLDDPTHIPLLE